MLIKTKHAPEIIPLGVFFGRGARVTSYTIRISKETHVHVMHTFTIENVFQLLQPEHRVSHIILFSFYFSLLSFTDSVLSKNILKRLYAVGG